METTWSELCRGCLSASPTISIFETQNLKQTFLEITTIEANIDDGLPQNLCENCYESLIQAYTFREQCVKMDSELKLQLQALLGKTIINDISKSDENLILTDVLSNDSMEIDQYQQLKNIIKTEPMNCNDDDDDEDYCYVLVIDDPKENENSSTTKVKEEKIETTNFDEISDKNFKDTIDSFLVSDTKVPINVPATILQNEEGLQEDEQTFGNQLNIDLGNDGYQETISDNIQFVNTQENSVQDIVKAITSGMTNENTKNSFIKILDSDGTILLKSAEQIAYLTNSELNVNDDGDSNSPEEVIFCEGDDSTQFQVLKCEDGAELVIEYADDGQIATVLQQEIGVFLCECGKKFEDFSEYETHQYTHNPGEEHLCNLCGKGFESAEILVGHTLLHNFSGLIIMCPFCNQPIKRNTLTQHIKYGHSSVKPECQICKKTFANPNNLKRHMMIHSGIKEFECDICFKRFHQKITMQTHRITHMNPFLCVECDESFDTKSALANHKESNECTRSKVTKIKEELMKSIKQKVTTNLGNLLGYACSLCKKMFSVESALEQHIESVHIVDPNELLCSECGEILPSRKQMQSHILTHKTVKSRNAKRFACSICGKGCASQAMLVMHERVHTNERPFPCHLCSLSFKTKTHLRTHQLTHTREKKFGCSVCMKFFALKGNLVVHLRTHTGERPYVCSICGDAFIDSKYLKKHKLKKHAIDNLPWYKY